MKKIRVTVEMDLTVEDSGALQQAAAQTMYEIERDAERRGVQLSADGDDLIAGIQASDTDALAQLVELELNRTARYPGCQLGSSEVRAVEIVPGAPEGRAVGKRPGY